VKRRGIFQRRRGSWIFDSEFGGKKADGRSGPKKIEADLTWDAMAKKYLEMFGEARSNG